MTNIDTLFQPYELNNKIKLNNRILMAPMTRHMSHDDWSPTAEMADYYERRADTGLIVTEGTVIRPDATGFTHVPGIFTDKHIAGWQRVTDKVHNKNGRIFLQIWHVGRASHPNYINGALPLSASETVMTGHIWRTKDLFFGKSRAASLEEIKGLVESYAIAAENAIKAGFDGVEIHGANGYLIDQFLHYNTNLRTDEYGGSAENMTRFALEIVKACGETIGFERTSLRLSPGGYLNEIVGDPRDAAVFQHLLEALNLFNIAYVHTGNFNDKTIFETLHHQTMTQFMRNYYHGTLVASGSYQFNEAAEGIEKKEFDLIAIGRPFIANPHLISQLKNNQPIKQYDAEMLKKLY